MTSPFSDIIERSRRRQRGEDVSTPNRFDDVVERSRQRQAEADAAAQQQAIARARTLTRPATATPMDRPVDPGVPGPVAGFGGSGGGVEWDEGRGFGANLGRSLYDAAVPRTVEYLGSSMQTAADALPQEGFYGAGTAPLRTGLRTIGRSLEDVGGRNRLAPPRVRSIGEALDSPENAADYLGSTLGEGLGSSAGVLAAGVVGGIPGALGFSYGQQVGEVGEEFRDVAPDMDPTRRARAALGLAVPLAALDMVTEMGALRGARSALAGEAKDYLARRSAGEIARNIAGGAAKGALTEGVTEAAQEGGQYFGVRGLAGTPMDLAEGLKRMGEAGIAGALPGAVMGGAGRTFEEAVDYTRRPKIPDAQVEPIGGLLPGQRAPDGPDFEVEDDFAATPVPVVETPSAATPPRPGNVPEAPAAKRQRTPAAPASTPAPPVDIASALDAEVAPPSLPVPVAIAPELDDFAPDVMPTPEEMARGEGMLAEAESAPAQEPITPEVIPEAPAPVAPQAEGYITLAYDNTKPDEAVSPALEFLADEPAEVVQAIRDEVAKLDALEAGLAGAGRTLGRIEQTGRDRLRAALAFVDGAESGTFALPEAAPVAPSLERAPVPANRPVDAPAASPAPAPAARDERASGPLADAGGAPRVESVLPGDGRAPGAEPREGRDDTGAVSGGTDTAARPGGVAPEKMVLRPVRTPDGGVSYEMVPVAPAAQPEPAPSAQPAAAPAPDYSAQTDKQVRDRMDVLRAKRRSEGLTEAEQQEASDLRAESARRYEVDRERRRAEDAAKKQAVIDAGNKALRDNARDALYLSALPDVNRAIYDGNPVEIENALDELVDAQRNASERFGDPFQNVRIREILSKYRPEALAELDALVAAKRAAPETTPQEPTNADRTLPAENAGEQPTAPARTGGDVGGDVGRGPVAVEPDPVPGNDAGGAALDGAGRADARGGDVRADAAPAGENARPGAKGPAERDAVAGADREPGARAGGRQPAERAGKKQPRVTPDVPSEDSRQAPDAQGNLRPDALVKGENYIITDDDAIGSGGPKGKARANLAAIRVLKQIEAEARPATRAEQEVMVKYVGWGGLPQAFRDTRTGRVAEDWRGIAEELESLLTEEELSSARASTNNAHYTSPAIIRAIFDLAQRLGVTPGRFLEPSMGVGHFIGLTPDALRAASWHGTELDSLSARLTKHIYPNADVRAQGFERMIVPDDWFDAAFGNPPFGDYQLADPRYDQHRFFIHDYFFAKSIDKVRPGGVLLYITSQGTMNKRDAKARRYIADRADLIGAVRLPSTAFEKNAMTSVTTDLLVFQKRDPKTPYSGHPFLNLAEHTNARGETVTINEYFAANPSHMLGIMSLQGTMRRGGGTELTLEPTPGMDMTEALTRVIAQFPENVYRPRAARTSAATAQAPIVMEASVDMPGTLRVENGVLQQSIDGQWAPAPIPKPHVARVSALVGLRNAVNRLLAVQQEAGTDAEVAKTIADAKKQYLAFVKQYGAISDTKRTVTKRLKKDGTPVVLEKQPNLEHFNSDPLYYRVLALESYDAETNTAKPSALLEGRVLGVSAMPERFDNAIDAFRAVLTTRGSVDVAWMAERTQLTEEQVVEQLAGRIFREPATGRYETAAQYLSGNVRAKLQLAQMAAEVRPEYRANVEALTKVLPEDIAPTDIDASLGAAWIPTETVKAFVGHLLDGASVRNVRVTNVGGTAWTVQMPWELQRDERARTTWGTDRVPLDKLLMDTLNQKTAVVRVPVEGGGSVVDPEASALAKERQRLLREEWSKWLWADDARAEALSRIYNDRFNVWAEPVFDGSDLQFPGAIAFYKGKPFELRPHQKNAVARYLENGNQYLGHVVGAGKTFTAAAIAVEARRLGLAKKPMIVTPNHMLGQWTTEFLAMYPTARLLVADADEFAPANRAEFVAKAAGQEWDAIIIKSSAFTKLPVSEARQIAMVEAEIEAIEAARVAMEKDGKAANRNAIKEVENRKKKLTAKLKRLQAEDRKDQTFTFEETGVDLLIVDEAHEYKNLFLFSSIQGLGQEGSQRAYDMYLKTQVMHDVNPGRGLVFMSGTPVSNSFSELYTLMRYLQPQALRQLGVESFDAWVSMFAENEVRYEKRATGEYKPKGRYTAFMNLPELRGAFGQVLDVKTQEDLQLPRPPIIGGQPDVIVAPQTENLRGYIKKLAARAKNLKPGKPQKGEDNFLSITNDGRIAGLDVRLVDATAEDDPNSKVNLAVDKLVEIHAESTPYKGVQLVFLDLSLPGSDETNAARARGGVPGLNIYEDVRDKLVARGIPEREIAFAQDFKGDEKKAALFADVRAGRKRIVLTSTPLMGAGTNVQDRLVALHRLDVPWKPSDLEQSEGRILRQGNLLYNEGAIPGVRILRYVTKGSYDEQIWSMVLGKQRMVSAVLKGTNGKRRVEDADEVTLSYQQAMAAATDNPLFLEKIELDMQIGTLRTLAAAHADEKRGMRARRKVAQEQLPKLEAAARRIAQDITARVDVTGDKFAVTIGKKGFTERKAAAEPLKAAVDLVRSTVTQLGGETQERIGTFAGFPLEVHIFRANEKDVRTNLVLVGQEGYTAPLAMEATGAGMVASLEHLAKSIEKVQTTTAENIERTRQQLKQLDLSVDAPFPQLAELEQARARLAEVESQLDGMAAAMAKAEEEIEAADPDELTAPDEEDSPGEYDADEERFAYTDPLSATIGQALRFAKQKLAEIERETRPLYTSEFADVEERLRAAEKGLPTLPWLAKARAAWQQVRQDFQRHFPHLDTVKDGMHALAHELLLRAERSGSWAKAKAADQLLGVAQGLTKAEVQLMTRYLALDDIQKDIDAGLYARGNPVPFYGYAEDAEGNVTVRSVTEAAALVEQDLGRLDYQVGQRPAVKAAIDRRNAMARALTQKLVQIDALPKSVLEDPRYYHRQVLSYAEERIRQQAMGNPTGAGTPREVRQRKRGFQKGRVGGADFNLAWQEAEYEWVAQANQTILLHELLAAFKAMDQTPALKAQANALNLARFEEINRDAQGIQPGEEGYEDPLQPFRAKIAMAKARIVQAIARGDYEPAPRFQRMIAQLLEAEANGERFSHPLWWAFLSDLAATEHPSGAHISALSIFKAIRDRKALIEETLGDSFLDPSDPDVLLQLAGPGYRTWQPEKGNVFYSALTLPEKAIIEGTVDGLEADQLRRVMVMGGKKPTWILPEGIARTLDDLTPAKQSDSALERGWMATVRMWKAWTLLAPARMLKYNFNNLAGDLDASLLAPAVVKQVPGAARDLWQYMMQSPALARGTPLEKNRDLSDKALVAEMQDAIQQGVVDQGLTAAEIPDILDLPGFERLAQANPLGFMTLVGGYWKHARQFTQYRENILRLAAWRHFKAELAAGRRPLGVSNRRRVQLLDGRATEQAALLARDLVGDYGNVTVAGEKLRERVFPFYSWMEVNAKRYVNFARNLPYEETGPVGGASRLAASVAARVGLSGASFALSLGARAGVALALASAFLFAVAAWNALLWPDEWDELRKTGRDGHLILGKTGDGRIQTVRLEGAFADFLGWVGLKDLPADIRDLVRGQQDFGDVLEEAVKAPVAKLVGALEPTSKTLMAFFTKKQTYPDPFNPRPIRDPAPIPFGVWFDQWGLGTLYRQVVVPTATGGAIPATPTPPTNPLLGLLAYQVDAGEVAYNAIRSQAYEWAEKQGKPTFSATPNDKANALYFWKLATKWGEPEAAAAWLQRYRDLGGTSKGAMQSIERAEPLANLTQKERAQFLATLTPIERERLQRAQAWYRSTMKATGRASLRGVGRPTTPAPADSSWIDRYRAATRIP